ncbi:hypothetical protein RQ90_22420, partial [Acinetobacter baumannii]|uniref:winged helix-turn-helix domain-containing protein n=1 Tax=Acinetobacter baumannii TaxID=470 RepID=UPI00057D43D5
FENYIAEKPFTDRFVQQSQANLEDKLYDFDSDVTSNTIEVYVHHLRAKLGKDFIRTIRGLGYRLGQS